MPSIDPLSKHSLFVELLANGELVGNATGFAVQHQGSYFLITNWHVLSGIDPDTGEAHSESDDVPDEVRVWHHGRTLGQWLDRSEALLTDSGEKHWIEHPCGMAVDVAAVRLGAIDDKIEIYPFDLSLSETDIVAEVAMTVSIIGFPRGLEGPRKLPIWKTGHIASEPQVDFKDQPSFLIDASTTKGMSGSPVVLKPIGIYATRSGGRAMSTRSTTLFLGVYSGRTDGHEIGQVWRPRVITELLEKA